VRLRFSAVVARHPSLNVCAPVVVKAAPAAFWWNAWAFLAGNVR